MSHIRFRAYRRVILGAGIAGLIIVLGTGGFLLTRSFNNGSQAQADQPGAVATGAPAQATWPPYPPGKGPGQGPAYVDPPGRDVTPIPGATPDISQPWWFVPYVNQDSAKPRFEGTVNGIVISTSPIGPEAKCEAPSYSTLDLVAGTELGIEPAYLPAGAVTEPTSGGPVLVCDGTPVSAEAAFSIPADEKGGVRGGDIWIYRYRSTTARAQALAPADRWTSGTVGGVLAAIAQPILPDLGIGNSAIIFYRDGVVTRLTASGIPLDQLQKVAEGLAK